MEDLTGNTFNIFLESLTLGNFTYKYFDISKINEKKYSLLPFSIRVILESAVRNCNELEIKSKDVKNILNWPDTHLQNVEVPFMPSRVILQDFTGIPAIVDLAAIRDAVDMFDGDSRLVRPSCPVDLALDSSLQVDISRKLVYLNKSNDKSLEDDALSIGKVAGGSAKKTASNNLCPLPVHSSSSITTNKNLNNSTCLNNTNSNNQILIESVYKECPFHFVRTECADILERNQILEFERSLERFQLLKWSSNVFNEVTIIPPECGLAHQVNLESLARIVFNKSNLLYPDSLVGTDSHTTMVNGIGVVGWSVGGVEAESIMLGQVMNMVLPQVVGYKIVGKLNEICTSTDAVLTIIKNLRQLGVSNKFVEFFGSGVTQLSISDRETIANMCPEYGAIIGYFAVDELAIQHLIQTGRKKETIEYIREYLKAIKLFRDYSESSVDEPKFSEVHVLDLSTVLPCVSGPKRPVDKTVFTDLKIEFKKCLTNKTGFTGFGLKSDNNKEIKITHENQEYTLRHGSVLIVAINSCTNNSNHSAMLAAGMLAKKATDLGLQLNPYIRTSLSPGNGVVTEYLNKSGLLPSLEKLGFNINGYGCLQCIKNINSIDDLIVETVDNNGLITVGVLSGNRNFEGRINPTTKANYLASPPLAVAFAIAGRIDIDFEKEPLGFCSKTKKNIYLKDIWPSRKELHDLEMNHILPAMYSKLNDSYSEIKQWTDLDVPNSCLFPWNSKSTYIKRPPFFDQMTLDPKPIESIKNAHVLLYLGDSITTDHISPAGSIARNCPAAKYLTDKGLVPREFNSYGSRRGNDAIMSRGTFANMRLYNKIVDQVAPKTIHFPSNKLLDIYDAAELYKYDNIPLIVIAGKEYGTGSSRDWAAKGQWMLGIKAVIAESFDRIHRSNLISMGIIPFQFLDGENSKNLKLTGKEKYTIHLSQELTVKQIVEIETNNGIKFKVETRIDSNTELMYIRHGGLLQFLVRKYI